ncbi:fatty-acyl-CoA synthase [Endobacter medicaginis]|uniref:Acyl-CoA synthetase n=1 Tax=Endobacter medicaginis TaxID=1181271 RepID=A0A839UXS7_9PROT|nr:acyl-CoA synthetase [Endobacter medicaginis]MBB3173445.1 fatty-acyl-CoA synthase [Endobacter medicaginis]MCX5475520.1 acyl-CoA synthetase [Endobacter medicaginis]NVN30165.1 acyl-CoA synthetase [Endobacter medicaginis]
MNHRPAGGNAAPAFDARQASLRTMTEIRAIEPFGLPPDLPCNTYAVLCRAAGKTPDRIALSFFAEARAFRRARHWSFAELLGEVTKFANVLYGLGIRADDVTAIMLPNLPETHMALWGAEAAGIAMPLNPLSEVSMLAALLNAAKARVLVTLSPFPGTDLHEKATALARMVPTLRHILLIDPAAHVRGLRGVAARLTSWRSRLRHAAFPPEVSVSSLAVRMRTAQSLALRGARLIAPTDIASYFATGGTTGLPKIAVRTHGQEVANVWMMTRTLGGAISSESTMFCGLPLFHVNAALVSGLACFLRGARVVLGSPQGFRGPGLIDHFWQIVEHYRINTFSAVPTVLVALLDRPVGASDISSLACVFCGAAPLSADLLRRFEAHAGVAVIEGYGLTETACAAAVNPIEGERQPGSVGFALPLTEIRILLRDAEGRFIRDAAPDEVGTVAICGPHVFSGYLDGSHNKGLWIDRGDGRRWLDTGDLGRLDARGCLWLTGRAKDLIIRGGHNIDPAIIEEALLRHPAVLHAAAIGRPDAYAGEIPVAYVQLRPGATTTPAALLADVSGQIAERAAIPRAIMILDAMPLTPVGKIHKPSLRLLELTELATSQLRERGIAFSSVRAEPGSEGVPTLVVHAGSSSQSAVLGAFEPLGTPVLFTQDAGGG